MMLTRRQAQVAELILAGSSQREIAAELGIAVHTVKIHTSHIRSLLDMPRWKPINELPRKDLRAWIDQHTV